MPVVGMLALIMAGGLLVYNNQSQKAQQTVFTERATTDQSSAGIVNENNNNTPEKKTAVAVVKSQVSKKKRITHHKLVAAIVPDVDSNKKVVSKQDNTVNTDDNDPATPLDESLVLDYASKKKGVTKTDNATAVKSGQNSETVIVNPIGKKSNTVHPQTGWANFEKYVYGKAISPDGKTGMVKLSFTVNTDGILSDFKVIKSVSAVADQMAIDIVKNGPGWMGESNGQPRTITNSVQFHKAG
jgi:TonB family protein